MEAGRQGFEADGAGGVEEDHVRGCLALSVEFKGDFIGDDAACGPAADDVGALGLSTAHFGDVEGRDTVDAAGVVLGGFHVGAIETVDADVGVDGRYGGV